MITLIQYRSKGEGIRVYAPIYIPLEILVEATYDMQNHKKKDMQINVDNDSIVLPHFLDVEGELEHERSVLFQHYILKPRRKGRIRAKIQFLPTHEFSEEDTILDNHIGTLVQKITYSLVSQIMNIQESAYAIYEYIRRIPFTDNRSRGLSKPRTPTQVIKSNRARKCVCKAELFKDMCRLLGIPARRLGAEHYRDTDIEKYVKRDKKYGFNRDHAFCAFYDKGWQLTDPTLGGFSSEFKRQNYYDRLVSAEGALELRVSAKALE